MKKRFAALIMAMAMILTMFAGCSPKAADSTDSSEPSSEPIVFKLADGAAAGSANAYAADMFAQLLEEKTEGRMKLDVHHAAALGNERDALEGLQMNTIDIALITPGYLAAVYPKISLIDQPYLFTSMEEAHEVIDGEIGQIMYDEILAQTGVHTLGSLYANFRVMNTTFPINSAADLAGRKMRVPEVKSYIDLMTALGANSTPVAFTETYTALSTDIVEGVEVSPDLMVSMAFHEVTDYCAITNHVYSTIFFLMSSKAYDQIPEDLMDEFMAALEEARQMEKKVVVDAYEASLKTMEDSGLTITYPDLSEFQELCKGNQDAFAKENGCEDLLEMIRNK